VIEEVEYENGEVVDTQLIRHHFHFDSFRPFGILVDFAIPCTPWEFGLSTSLFPT
jgi:hypothetical protein